MHTSHSLWLTDSQQQTRVRPTQVVYVKWRVCRLFMLSCYISHHTTKWSTSIVVVAFYETIARDGLSHPKMYILFNTFVLSTAVVNK